MMHGFINMSGVLDQSKKVFAQITDEMRTAMQNRE
jgi:hypothetical protein